MSEKFSNYIWCLQSQVEKEDWGATHSDRCHHCVDNLLCQADAELGNLDKNGLFCVLSRLHELGYKKYEFKCDSYHFRQNHTRFRILTMLHGVFHDSRMTKTELLELLKPCVYPNCKYLKDSAYGVKNDDVLMEILG